MASPASEFDRTLMQLRRQLGGALVRVADGWTRAVARAWWGMRAARPQRIRGHDVLESGYAVRRLLPARQVPMVGPFVLFDCFGPHTLAPGEGIDIAPHGHAHLATVTYFFAGSTHHQDSLGHDVVVEAGDVAWMHAGRGIVHAERTPDAFRMRGGLGHGIQAWAALPEAEERSAPRFQLARRDAIPRRELGANTARVLVGEAFGVRSPIETASPVLLVELRTGTQEGTLELEPSAEPRALFFADGYGALDGRPVGVGTLALLADGAATIRLAPDTTVLLLGGAPLGTRHLQGNVIGSSLERLERALRELP